MGVGCMVLFSCFPFGLLPRLTGGGAMIFIPCSQVVKTAGFDPVNIGSNPIAVIYF